MARDNIDLIDAKLLKVAAPEAKLPQLEQWVEPIKAACREFGIDTVREIAAFIGQGAHECKGFTDLDEDLSYSAERLMKVWPKRFPTLAKAEGYARNPQRLANNVYANRLGNGDELSGDGYRYRGAGMFQQTGKYNHQLVGKAMGIPLDKVGDWLRTPAGAARAAGWYFQQHDLGRLAETAGVEDETKAINGGYIGLADRRQRFDAVVKELLRRGA